MNWNEMVIFVTDIKKKSMSYSEEDKCYGIAGMAMGLTIFEADELYNSITIEKEGLDCIEFTSNYYFAGNPAMSAKKSWHYRLETYQITSGVVIADAMCRTILGEGQPVDRGLKNRLFEAISEEGRISCQLDDDEVERLFEKTFSYLYELLSNYQVQNIVRNFAKEIKSRRTMSQHEVAELLDMLRGI